MKGKRRDTKFTFPDLTPITKTKSFPRYTSILTRPDGDGVGIEELDNLQMEIESLLVDAMQRTRTFKLQIMLLENGDESVVVKSKSTAQPSSLQTTPYKTQKRNKLANSKLMSTPNASSKPAKVTESPIVRNDIPDVFWNSIEPYCAEITDNDIKMLEDQIDMFQNDCRQKVPPLGKHYAVKWAKEDLEAEIKENGRLKIDTNGQSTPTTTLSGKRKINDLDDNHFFGLMDDAKKYQSDSDFENPVPNSQQFGPLTQRLISALIEQNLMTPFDTDVSSMNDLKTASKAPQHMSPRTLSKQFKNQTSLEWNIKKELLEQGLLDNVDLEDNISADDEIANEIKSLQHELVIISGKCEKTHRELLGNARKEMSKQKIKKKIDIIDTEIKDIFNKLVVFKQTSKPISKKEKERAKKLIKDRETLKSNLND